MKPSNPKKAKSEWWKSPDEVCALIERAGWRRLRVNFSAGKDSIVAVHLLKERGFEIDLFYFEAYPGMPLMREVMDRYEDVFGLPIARLPHPLVFGRNSELVYQSPTQVRVIEQLNCHETPTFEEIIAAECSVQVSALPRAIAIKALDSTNRFRTIWRSGVIDVAKLQCYPLGCVSTKWIWEYIYRHKIPVPEFYRVFGESLDVPRTDMMHWLREHHPQSHAHIMRTEPFRYALQKAREHLV